MRSGATKQAVLAEYEARTKAKVNPEPFLLRKPELIHTPQAEKRIVQACLDAGGLEAMYCTTDFFVDGLDGETSMACMQFLSNIVRKNLEPKGLVLDALSRRFCRLSAEQGLRTNPAFAGTYAFNTRTDYAKLFPDFLDGMPDGGVIMCHPGIVDAELTRLDPLTDLRAREYAFFLDEGFPKLLAQRGVAL